MGDASIKKVRLSKKISGGTSNVASDYSDVEETLQKLGWGDCILYESQTELISVHDTEYNILRTSKSIEKNFGKDVIGQKCYRAYQKRNAICPDCPMARLLATGEITCSSEQIANDRIYTISSFPLFNEAGKVVAVVEIARDITERRQAESDLREATAFWYTVFNSTSDLISVINVSDFTIVDANDAFLKAYGLSREQAIGKTCYGVTHHLPSPCTGPLDICPLSKVLPEGKHCSVEHTHHDAAGNEIITEVSASPIRDEKGEIVRMVHVARDITERKQKDKELKTKEEDLSLSRKSEALKDEFVGMVSHEIKTPLTIIIGALSTAEMEGITQQEIRELIDGAFAGARDLSAMVDNLIEFARHQSNHLSLQTIQTDIGPVIETVVGNLQSRLKTHRIITDIPPLLPPIVIDRIRIERVIHNLINNAIKYSPQGGTIKVTTRQKTSRQIISVRDQGIGIPLQDQERIFNNFERIGQTGQSISGIGLGLSVCRIIVEAHGGKIWVKSHPGKGSTFYVSLPTEGGKPAS